MNCEGKVSRLGKLKTYMAEARDWTNLKIPNAHADLSTKTPPSMEITWDKGSRSFYRSSVLT